MLRNFLFAAICVLPLGAAAAPCPAEELLTLPASPRVVFHGTIGPERQRRILQVLARVRTFSGELEMPSVIQFQIVSNDQPFSCTANLEELEIRLSQVLLTLRDDLFDAVIAHEITHLVVGFAFADPYRQTSLWHSLQLLGDNGTGKLLLLYDHWPYAELICDTMAVLISGDLSIVPKVIDEVRKATAAYPEMDKSSQNSWPDLPEDLSRRDFKLDPADPRWGDYKPLDFRYNRFAQVRAYLGQRWLSSLPPAGYAPFMVALVKTVNEVFKNGGLSRLIMLSGEARSNPRFIEYLERELGQALEGP